MFRTSQAFAVALFVLGFGTFANIAHAQLREPQRLLCRTCHAGQFASTERGPHSVLSDEEWAQHLDVDFVCTACHGDVAAHISAGGSAPVFAFKDEPASEKAAVCLGCHEDDHPRFENTSHSEAGLACTSCHSQHNGLPGASNIRRVTQLFDGLDRVSPKSALCVECHADKLALFSLNERHRLQEGVLECTSCHNPHAAEAPGLGGFAQELCLDCHDDKGGPFVFEHPASRVEGCTTCHNPHGSPNRHLLNYQRVAELCIGCHAAIPQFHTGFSPVGPPRFSLDTQCTNCHSKIHGSNFEPHFLR